MIFADYWMRWDEAPFIDKLNYIATEIKHRLISFAFQYLPMELLSGHARMKSSLTYLQSFGKINLDPSDTSLVHLEVTIWG